MAAKKMFDCFSWQAFAALNFPADPKNRGNPLPGGKITDPGPRVWETFMPVYSTFQAGDLGWQPPDFKNPPKLTGQGCDPSTSSPGSRSRMILTLGSKSRDVVNETGQALAGTFGNLIDRNGNEVRYEVLINQTEYDYIVNNGFAETKRLTPGGPHSCRLTSGSWAGWRRSSSCRGPRGAGCGSGRPNCRSG